MLFPFPFEPTASPLVKEAKVNIEFAGQMLLQPGADDTHASRTCQIGINRFSRDHTLQVMLIVKEPTLPPTIIPLLRGPLTDDFVIRLGPDPDARPGNFRVFAPTAEPFVRTAAGNHDHDYRWTLNLRNPQIHPNATRGRGAEPVVKLRAGTLYAPRLTPVNLQPKLKRGEEEIPLIKIAPELVASIVPSEGDHVLLEWSDMGDPVRRVLPRDGDHRDTVYTVSFINDPPANTPPHEELSLYYKVLRDGASSIPPDRQFQLTFAGGISSDLIPCMPVVLNP